MKKILSFLLALTLIIGVLPAAALAAGGSGAALKFTSDFSDSKGLNDTFKVTVSMVNNPGVACLTLVLDYNEDVVHFTGFESTSFNGTSATVNPAIAKYTWAPGVNATDDGTVFVANFTIVGYGEPDICLNTGKDGNGVDLFEVYDEDDKAVSVTLDYSEIADIYVDRSEDVEVTVPDDAPFLDISLEEGKVLKITQMEDIYDVPHYRVYLPAGTEKVYITQEHAYILENEQTYEASAWPFLWDFENEAPGFGNPFSEWEQLEDGSYKITYDVGAEGMGGAETSCLTDEYGVAAYAISSQSGPETPVCFFTFAYPYGIFIEDADNGTVEAAETGVAGDRIKLTVTPEEGYELDLENTEVYALDDSEVTITKSSGKYWFTMPEAFVEIYPEFKEKEVIEPEAPEGPASYSITVSDSKGLVTAPETAAAGDTVSLTVGDAAGYEVAVDMSYEQNGQTITTTVVNNQFIMPEANVNLTVSYQKTPYTITVANTQNGSVSAPGTAGVGDVVMLNVVPERDYKLSSLSVMQGGNSISLTGNSFVMPAGDVTVTAVFEALGDGYRFATSTDVSMDSEGIAVVRVFITGHSNPEMTTYNAYDVTLKFDNARLEPVTKDNTILYSGAVKDDGGEVKVEGNTIRIVGVGDAKEFGKEIAALTFKAKGNAAGPATVSISKVQVSDQNAAISQDIPEAEAQHRSDDTSGDTTPDQSVITVPYKVNLSKWISGNSVVVHGSSYTFWFTDADPKHYTYNDIQITMDGVSIDVPQPDAEGKYTIENVTGPLNILASQSATHYFVNVSNGGAAVTLPNSDGVAYYGIDYKFGVTPSGNKVIDSVVVKAGENIVTTTIDTETGKYVIPGTAIEGDLTITVTQADPAPATTTVTLSGISSADVDGGMTTYNNVTIGQPFTFKLLNTDKKTYTVMVGEQVIAMNEGTEGAYTIPGELVLAGGVTVNITAKVNVTVEVNEYFKLNGKVMYLVTAVWENHNLNYGDVPMFYSNKYTVGEGEPGAFCYLVVSTEEMNTVDAVKAAAEEAICLGARDSNVIMIEYDYDINGTTNVDVNDAQLAYDMYNTRYMEFTENLPMKKFLEADMSDAESSVRCVNALDVAAIIDHIING